jgi:hypothetical protein
MRVRRGQGDDGQAATAFVVIGLAVMLLLVLKYMTPLAQAGDHFTEGQTAAEASALAGAQAIADDSIPALLGAITTPGDLARALGGASSQLGSGDAARLAADNDADLISYDYDWRSDRVTATVRPTSTADGQIKPVSATARVGFSWSCSWSGLPSPSPTSPTPSPSPSPTTPVTPPPPPADQTVTLQCGSTAITFTLVGRTGLLRLSPPGQLSGLFRPRLVG